jgi:hypothetical protein
MIDVAIYHTCTNASCSGHGLHGIPSIEGNYDIGDDADVIIPDHGSLGKMLCTQ